MSKRLLSAVHRRARQIHRRYIFARAMRTLMQDPLTVLRDQPEILGRLIYGWNNEAWSADRSYLAACLEEALKAPGPFLECGSGLSTILIGAVAKCQGKKLWSLEHSAEWKTQVQHCLDKYSIDSVTICHAPLRQYADFEWYDIAASRMPRGFDLVICDGPPGGTLGGRVGLLPVMRDYFLDGATILLDDAHRPTEQQIIKRWRIEYGVNVAKSGEETQFAFINVPIRYN